MEIEVAIKLIEKAFLKSITKEKWADLGSGNGLFTSALSHLLPNGSEIESVDQNSSINLQKIEVNKDITIKYKVLDMNIWVDQTEILNGILMANSLHYIKNKELFIIKALKKIPNGKLIVIEYDSTNANHWVPYPITYQKLQSIVLGLGENYRVEKIHETPSKFRGEMIYTALVTSTRF